MPAVVLSLALFHFMVALFRLFDFACQTIGQIVQSGGMQVLDRLAKMCDPLVA